jgi:putative acetyltransferase
MPELTEFHIGEASPTQAAQIKKLYLESFGDQENALVAQLAVELLVTEKSGLGFINLVALRNQSVLGHVAFSPLTVEGSDTLTCAILSPLAVSPASQGVGLGAILVKRGIDLIRQQGITAVFVYGDPNYYQRFGFAVAASDEYIPPFPLAYPSGWQILAFEPCDRSLILRCCPALAKPELW